VRPAHARRTPFYRCADDRFYFKVELAGDPTT
jgi:hypothetical protein